MIKNIGFDIDGVLMDYEGWATHEFLKAYLKITGQKYDGRMCFDKSDVQEIFCDCHNTAVLDTVKHNFLEYCKHAPFESFVKPLFQELHKMKMRIHIVTARFEEDGSEEGPVYQATIDRFRSEGIPFDELHFGSADKLQIIKASGIELMVEDTVKNILSLSNYIPVFKMWHVYNKELFGSNIYTIKTLYPRLFIDKLKFADSHRNYLGSTTKVQDKQAIAVSFTHMGHAILNPNKVTQKCPKFVVPLSGESVDTIMLQKIQSAFSADTIYLSDIDSPEQEISNPIVRQVIHRYNPDGMDISATNEMSADIYKLRCKIIDQIIETAAASRNHVIIYGAELLLLNREHMMKLKDYPFILPNISSMHRNIITEAMFKKDYNVALLMEDLDEVSMNVRKFKIISGIDPSRLLKYTNRQYFSSDGIDTVKLLSGERPYCLEQIMAGLSLNTFIMSDLHLDAGDTDKTDMIVDNINVTVSSTDKLLFLGDFDAKGKTNKKTIQEFLRRLSCKNVYMLIGNNDGFTIKDYAEMGFKGITDTVTFNETGNEIIFSHCPVPVTDSQINVHGHLHGGRKYWNIDWRNHIDVWSEDYVPMRLRDILKCLQYGWYEAKSVNVGYY